MRQLRLFFNLSICCFIGFLPQAAGANDGQALFNSKGCAACHSVGGGRLVGPDLAGVTERRDSEWLQQMIPSVQAMIDAGDADVAAMVEEYKMVMPDQNITAAEVDAILAYLSGGAAASEDAQGVTSDSGAAQVAEPAVEAPPAFEPSPGQIAVGQALFQGTQRLENGGPACNACHDVVNDAVIGGGVLAKELTDVFSRMGAPGVSAILGAPPFPVMQAAYKDRPLTEEEIVASVAFLKDADEKQELQQPRDYGMKLFYSGAGGVGLLYGFYAMVWSRRRRGSVNQEIYDRQVKSE